MKRLVLPMLSLALFACTDPEAPLAATTAPGDGKADTVEADAANRALLSSQFHWVEAFGGNPGNLRLAVFEPSRPRANAPLVVALHGCKTPELEFAKTGWNTLAEAEGFYVLYPHQAEANNPYRCFNWFTVEDTTRDRGEPASIRAMIAWAQATYNIDASRVFVTGLSAGGGMTAVMLATYPEVFAAGGIMAGVPYGCSVSPFGALACMNPGRDFSPTFWASEVRRAAPLAARYPRVAIWQGDADSTVVPQNADELMEQWTGVHKIDQVPETTLTEGRVRTQRYADAAGAVQVELVTVADMGHVVPVAPAQGCGEAGAFITDEGICAVAQLARFFGVHP